MTKRPRSVVKRAIDPTVPERITTAEALQKILNAATAEGYRESTLSDYRKIWRFFFTALNEELGEKVRYIDEVTTDHFREYVAYCLQERNLSPVTVNVRIRALKAMFNRMFADDVITVNPAARVKKLRTDEKIVETFSDKQFKLYIDMIDKSTFAGLRDYAMILLMYDCGLRVNEISALEVSDIDFDNNVILLPGAKNKNRKTRSVPISEALVGLLDRLVKETREYFGKGTKHVFTTYYGDPIGESLVRKRMNELGKKSGLHGVVRCSPHTLRHTFARRCVLAGMDVFTLQKILGHADISTTRRYVDVKDEDLVRAHRKVSPLKHLTISDR